MRVFTSCCVSASSELGGRGRSKPVLRAREILAVTGVDLYHLRVKGIAEELRKHPVTGSMWVMRGRRLRQENKEVKKKIEDLDLALIEWLSWNRSNDMRHNYLLSLCPEHMIEIRKSEGLGGH